MATMTTASRYDIQDDSPEVVYSREVIHAMSRGRWIQSLGFEPYLWQWQVIESRSKRKAILGARQGGKSTIVAGIPCHTAKYTPGSLSLIFAPTENQAIDDMGKVKVFAAHDKTFPSTLRNSELRMELDNGSVIQVVVASDVGARGKSHPRCIVIDEASRVEDIVYQSAIRPMLNSNPECEMILISTPFGKQGFFWRAMEAPESARIWTRYKVVAPFVPTDDGFDLVRINRVDHKYMTRKAKEERLTGGYYFSPRSGIYEEQLENLIEIGPELYRQEFCCQFVEPEDMVFTYQQIDQAFSSGRKVAGLADSAKMIDTVAEDGGSGIGEELDRRLQDAGL
jgi:hypothetical protein